MSGTGATPLFIDTGAFYARIDDRDGNHGRARTVFDAIEAGDPEYRPLYTSGYVLAELVTLGLVRAHRGLVAEALGRIRASPLVHVVHPVDASFEDACDAFDRYDGQEVSIVDHLTGVLADVHGVEHVFTFDPDDFHTLGFTVVPHDVHVP